MGDDVFFGPGCMTTNDREIAYPDKTNLVVEPVIIEDNVRMGFGVIVLPGVTLAKNCRIGAGAVVAKDTKEGGTYVGVPAKRIS